MEKQHVVKPAAIIMRICAQCTEIHRIAPHEVVEVVPINEWTPEKLGRWVQAAEALYCPNCATESFIRSKVACPHTYTGVYVEEDIAPGKVLSLLAKLAEQHR